jgi:HEAT repeat protein
VTDPAPEPDPSRRGVPRRVRSALEGLRLAIARIPDLSRLTEGESRAARAGAVSDALSALAPDGQGDPGPLAYAFLMNIDLAASPEFPEETGENEALAAIPEQILLSLVPIFAADASGSARIFSGVLPPDRFPRLTGKIAFRLARSSRPEVRELLARLFDAGLVAMDHLPPDVQERVVASRLAVGFLAQKDSYLAALRQPVDLESYGLRARPSARVVPVLLDRGRYQEAVELVAVFAGHAAEQSARAPAASEAMGTMVETGVPEAARRAFLASGREEDRALLGRLLALFGARAVGHLVSLVREAADPQARRQAAEILIASGGEATAGLVEMLDEPALGPAAAAAAIRALGGIEDGDLAPLAAETVSRRAGDGDPEVRRAALHSLCLLAPQGRFEPFRAALDDPDPGVRREAIRGLGLSGDDRAFPLLREMVERAGPAGDAAGWTDAAPAIDALGHAARSLPGRREEVSRLLSAFAQRACPPGFLRRVARRPPPPLVLLALAYAAGRVGDDRSRRILAQLAREPDPEVAQKAASFLLRLDGEEKG